MRIAIDLNDVIRDYSDNFIKIYLTQYNHEFDPTDLELWTNELQNVLPFKTDKAYQKFVYEDYAFELFGKCDVCSRGLATELKTWCNKLRDLDIDEPIELMYVSPMEFGESINYSYFFISKLGLDIREVYFPVDSRTIWDKCDILITANPNLLNNKPEGKVSIKIKKDYNKESVADYEYKTLSDFISNENNTEKLLENGTV